jgi:hypothetical protein
LELLPGTLTPHAHEGLVRLGAWLPFDKSAQMLEQFLRVKISGSTARRYSEAAGAAYEAVQTEAVERIERELPEPETGPSQQLLSVDGAMVPLVKGEWAEVKTLVIGEVTSQQVKGQAVVQTQELSYFSRLTDADTFTRLALVETHRRGLETAQQVAAVTDGAEWNQSFVEVHRPDAVRILDFPHAAQRVSQIGTLCFEPDSATAQQWVTDQLHALKHEGPTEVLAQLQALKQHHPDQPILNENLAYLEKRQTQMQYPTFQAQGWPIGSGSVESANKLVVEARLKGAGMHWDRSQVNPMLALRNVVCNDRWAEAWPQIADRLRQQAADKRRQLQKQRRPQPQPRPPLPDLPLLPEPPPPAEPLPAPQPYRPAADHPWRRSPIGRARFSSLPKS